MARDLLTEKTSFTEPPAIDVLIEYYSKLLVTSKSGKHIRVRSSAGIKTPVLPVSFNSVPQEVLIVLPEIKVAKYPIEKDGHKWVYTIFAGGIAGWVALDLLTYTPSP